MVQHSPRKIWFPAKKYGWGWGIPVAWQGWVVLGLYSALFAVGAIFLLDEEQPTTFFIFVGAITIALLIVCWWKGEPPRWRWGGD